MPVDKNDDPRSIFMGPILVALTLLKNSDILQFGNAITNNILELLYTSANKTVMQSCIQHIAIHQVSDAENLQAGIEISSKLSSHNRIRSIEYMNNVIHLNLAFLQDLAPFLRDAQGVQSLSAWFLSSDTQARLEATVPIEYPQTRVMLQHLGMYTTEEDWLAYQQQYVEQQDSSITYEMYPYLDGYAYAYGLYQGGSPYQAPYPYTYQGYGYQYQGPYPYTYQGYGYQYQGPYPYTYQGYGYQHQGPYPYTYQGYGYQHQGPYPYTYQGYGYQYQGSYPYTYQGYGYQYQGSYPYTYQGSSYQYQGPYPYKAVYSYTPKPLPMLKALGASEYNPPFQGAYKPISQLHRPQVQIEVINEQLAQEQQAAQAVQPAQEKQTKKIVVKKSSSGLCHCFGSIRLCCVVS